MTAETSAPPVFCAAHTNYGVRAAIHLPITFPVA